MQIDFHHGATYVIARLAGFGHREADIVAHCAQYVDDATNDGTIRFDNLSMYNRIASAHKMVDYRNFEALANHRVWIPFHFLPGNGGKPAGEVPHAGFIEQIICRPDSYVARDMVAACIAARDKPYGLHRLGVTMHVYADTFAHQGFAGINHACNNVHALDKHGKSEEGLLKRLITFYGDRAKSHFVGDTLPLGHGTVLSFPDRPWLSWHYRDHHGNMIERNNPADFMAAAEAMCRAMECFRLGDPKAETRGLPVKDAEQIQGLLARFTQEDGEERHQLWLEQIGKGLFSFGKVALNYIPKGIGSWKYQALGTEASTDTGKEVFPFKASFLQSHWKLFHDATQAHRFCVLHDILPRYGIVAA